MPELSQRTLGKVIRVLSGLLPEDADTFPLMRDFWREKLFEGGFPDWLIEGAAIRSFNWALIIPALYSGKFKTDSDVAVPAAIAHQILRRSLQLDGFDVASGGMRPLDGPVSVEEEATRLTATLKRSKLGRQNVILKHLADAEEHFDEGKHHSAIGESRSALQAVIEETVAILETRVGRRSGSGTANEIDFLAREGLLSADEQQAYRSAWGFLSSGNHPGIPPEEAGRIGMILCLEFIQILLIKGENLL